MGFGLESYLNGDCREECGIAAVVLKKHFSEFSDPLIKRGGAPEIIYRMLLQQQHRGQLSAGIATFQPQNGEHLHVYKGLGKVDKVFKDEIPGGHLSVIDEFAGSMGIGHVRYATSGAAEDEMGLLKEAQPFYRDHGKTWKTFAIAFNGNLANYGELKLELERGNDYSLKTTVDTEVIMHRVSIALKRESDKVGDKPDLARVVANATENFDGAHNVVMLSADGDLVAWRDPLGIKPLVWGENENLIGIASESVSLTRVGIPSRAIRAVEPGTAFIYQSSVPRFARFRDSPRRARCMFDPIVYFGDPMSRIDTPGGMVENRAIRERLGEELALIEPLREAIAADQESFVLTYVPNTALDAATGMARRLRADLEVEIELSHAIRKNERTRTFIEKKWSRDAKVRNIYKLSREMLDGRRVIVVDDSIVRGTTARELVTFLKDAESGGGAREVHLRSSCPPIKAPCYYGVDFPTLEELAASKFNGNMTALESGLAKETGADSIKYQTLQGLARALGVPDNPESEFCMACLTKTYPTAAGERNFQNASVKFALEPLAIVNGNGNDKTPGC